MTKIISLILILTLSFQCLVKLGLITFYSFNKDFIIKELCENKDKPKMKCEGKCFLKKSMGLADKAGDQSSKTIKQVEFPLFLTHSFYQGFGQSVYFRVINTDIPNHYTHILSTGIFHPPLA